MDLDDSFTRKLLQRTMAHREEINKKLGLTPEVSSAKRRRTPLADEINTADAPDCDDENSDSPKRQCVSSNSSLGRYESRESSSPLQNNKENSPVMPVLGLRGLAALSRRNRENNTEPAAGTSNVSNTHEHEESQGFTKSVSNAKLSYAYKEGENSSSSTIKDRMKMFETSGAPRSAPQVVPALKKPPIGPPKVTLTQHVSSAPLTAPVNNNSGEVDPTEMSLAARRALFEAPILNAATEELSPEKLTVSQRTALFERAMASPSSKVNRTGRGPSPARREPVRIPLPSPVRGDPAPSNPAVSPSPSKYLPHSPEPASPANTPVKAAVPASFTRDVTPSPHRPIGSNLKPSPSILRKSDGNTNIGASTKAVSFNLPPSSPGSSLALSNDEPINVQVPKSPKLGRHTQEIQQRLLGQTQRSTSTSKMVESSIAERRKEMERLLFNKGTQPEVDDSIVTQSEDSYSNQDSTQESAEPNSSTSFEVSESLTETQEEGSSVDDSIGSLPPVMKPFEDDSELNDALEEAMQSEEETDEMLTPTPAPRPQIPFARPAEYEEESGQIGTPLLHSVSVYRRQKQAMCTPPVRVIQRKPLVDSPPSPPPAQDTSIRVEKLHERIQSLQENLHCQEVQVRQASQALYLCSAKPELFGSAEHIEGERLLLIASHKRNAYRTTLERLKTEAALGQYSDDNNSMGTLTLSDIRLPLKHDFLSAQMAGMHGDSVHFFFCLIRYQDKVIATEMLSTRTSDITAGTLSFSNHICLQDLRNNFHVLFEVYALQSSVENLSNHERKHSLKRDHGKAKAKRLESKSKLSPVLSSPMTGHVKERTSNFGLVGLIQFTVNNCSQKVMVIDKVPKCSPLDGRLYIKVQLCTQQPVGEKGFLTMFEDVSGFGAWHRRWVVLNGNHLSFWKYPDQVQTEVPIGSIDLRSCVTPEVGLVSADVCARKNTFMLFCVQTKSQDNHRSPSHKARTTKHLISADTKEERLLWCQQLNAALQTIRRWDPEALKPTDFPLHMQC